MGLDSYLGRIVYDKEGNKGLSTDGLEFPKVSLCGGMCSGDGSDGSFRGKVYAEFIEEFTGEDLYSDNINLQTIAEELEYYCEDEDHVLIPNGEVVHSRHYEVSMGEVRDLAKLFRYAADQGLSYHAWY